MYDKLRQMQKMLTKNIQELDSFKKKHQRLKNIHEKLTIEHEKVLNNYRSLEREHEALKEKFNLTNFPQKKVRNTTRKKTTKHAASNSNS